MIRRRIEEDDDNPERWLVSYADFITLLFAFFVVMYSVSSFKKVQHDELTQAINKAFSHKDSSDANPMVKSQASNSQTTQATLPADMKESVSEDERSDMLSLGQSLAQTLAPLIQNQQAKVMQNSRGLHVLILDQALFANGSADLTEEGAEIMRALAAPLRSRQHAIMVEGHTDNTPIHLKNTAFFSNWELSAVRASSIIASFNNNGLNKIRLSALGYGPSQPITSNDNPTGQAINRHMSILVLYDSISIKQGNSVLIEPKQIGPSGQKS